VIAAFPFDSQVRSVTDPGFAAGVESQKNHIHGVLKGLGTSSARVDFVPTGQKIEVGEMFFTSGEDRVFPKGLPAGRVTSVREGTSNQEITVEPSGTQVAPEEVLVIVDPVHQAVPESASGDAPVFLAPDIGPGEQAQQTGGTGVTTADKLRDEYKKIGDAQKHVFGVGEPGTLPPNFNLKVPGVNAPAAPATSSPAVPDKKGAEGTKPPVPLTSARPQPANNTPPAVKLPTPGVNASAAPATPSPGSPDKKAAEGTKPPAPLTPARPQPANNTPPAAKLSTPPPAREEPRP
jgi:rod shape-determining protein MreC